MQNYNDYCTVLQALRTVCPCCWTDAFLFSMFRRVARTVPSFLRFCLRVAFWPAPPSPAVARCIIVCSLVASFPISLSPCNMSSCALHLSINHITQSTTTTTAYITHLATDLCGSANYTDAFRTTTTNTTTHCPQAVAQVCSGRAHF